MDCAVLVLPDNVSENLCSCLSHFIYQQWCDPRHTVYFQTFDWKRMFWCFDEQLTRIKTIVHCRYIFQPNKKHSFYIFAAENRVNRITAFVSQSFRGKLNAFLCLYQPWLIVVCLALAVIEWHEWKPRTHTLLMYDAHCAQHLMAHLFSITG